MDVNMVILSGRLSKDVELRYSTGGVAFIKTSIAISKGKDKGADFFDLVAFKTTAEKMANNLSKGSEITIQGTVNNNNYKNKKGDMVYATQITVNHAYFSESGVQGGVSASDMEGFRQIEDGSVPF